MEVCDLLEEQQQRDEEGQLFKKTVCEIKKRETSCMKFKEENKINATLMQDWS